MTYGEFSQLLDQAWTEFFAVFAEAGVVVSPIGNAMDRDDCFNDVEDAILSVVKLKLEDEEE